MDSDESGVNPDRGREHIAVLRETIDRNRNFGWETYCEQYRFTLVDDGTVRLSQKDDSATHATSAVATEADHIVTLDGGVVVDCNCYIAQRRFDQKPCRHMRAVRSHPRL